MARPPSFENQAELDTAEKAMTEEVEETNETPVQTEDDRKLVRKIDLYVLPWLCITYALSLIDRTNIAAAKIVGMQVDLRLKGNQYNIALLLFFIPYILTEIPSNGIIRRVGTQRYLTILVAGWGVIAMCFGFVKTFGQLIALRVLLGVFEGGFNVSFHPRPPILRKEH